MASLCHSVLTVCPTWEYRGNLAKSFKGCTDFLEEDLGWFLLIGNIEACGYELWHPLMWLSTSQQRLHLQKPESLLTSLITGRGRWRAFELIKFFHLNAPLTAHRDYILSTVSGRWKDIQTISTFPWKVSNKPHLINLFVAIMELMRDIQCNHEFQQHYFYLDRGVFIVIIKNHL